MTKMKEVDRGELLGGGAGLDQLPTQEAEFCLAICQTRQDDLKQVPVHVAVGISFR